jgi:nitroimidazol reductase NimA-like FMN-containing flavoprotein (pyridoxamine 5'-phosphate oxidase superfamily)
MIGLLMDDEIEAMLRRHRVGRLGLSANDRPYVVPINYVYDGAAIYGYSTAGRKLEMMRQQPLVCFEVDEIDSPSSWRSVIAEGRFEEIDEPEARHLALRALTRGESEPVLRTIANGTAPIVVFRITLTDKAGRFERRDA